MLPLACTGAFAEVCLPKNKLTAASNFEYQGLPYQRDAAYKERFVRELFKNVLEDLNASQATYDRYISKELVQYVDGYKLTYSDYIAHREKQKLAMQTAKITIKNIVVQRNKVATIHIAEGIKKDNTYVKVQIHAFLQIKDGKVIRWEQLTRPIE